jgi:hypothetical protein
MRGLGRRDFDPQPFLTPDNDEHHRLSDRPFGEQPMDVIHTRRRLSVDGDDKISHPYAAQVCRPPRLYGSDLDAEFPGQLVKPGHLASKRSLLHGNA